jgi:hypothetical protein
MPAVPDPVPPPDPHPAPRTAQPQAALDAVLRVLRPVVGLLVRHGVTYPALAVALKRLFLDAAQQELQRAGKPVTDSALTLLSGVHRRDVRSLTRGPAAASAADASPSAAMGLSAEVVGRWLTDARYAGRRLPRSGPGSFDELVAGTSQDVRPRAVLDELLRLGVVHEGEAGIGLDAAGFAPRQDFADMSALFAANLHDHAAAAVANLAGEATHLEQAVFVDEIGAASAERLRLAAIDAWKEALQKVYGEAQRSFDADAATTPPGQRRHRARFGVYFYSTEATPLPPATGPTDESGSPR